MVTRRRLHLDVAAPVPHPPPRSRRRLAGRYLTPLRGANEAPERAPEVFPSPPADARSVIDRGPVAAPPPLRHAPLRFSLEDGTDLFDSGPIVATVLVRDPATLLSLLIDPEHEFGDAYSQGRIEVRGDLVAGSRPPTAPSIASGTTRRTSRVGHSLASRAQRAPPLRPRRRVLPPLARRRMVCTCAYFEPPGHAPRGSPGGEARSGLSQASLRPGERVVEAGSVGVHSLSTWHATTGRPFAPTTSRPNRSGLRASRGQERALPLVELVEDDSPQHRRRFDTFVSLGMLEHVGTADSGRLASVIRDCLSTPRTAGASTLHRS